MRFPDFLIIGAMKAGTTTLYYDLLAHEDLYLPQANKEPHCLCSDDVLTSAGRVRYARYFQAAKDHQRCGEASTGYTKLPDIPGVVERAAPLLPSDSRFIYLVREPISRIASHHHHESMPGNPARRGLSGGVDRDILSEPRFCAYSKYAMQVEPWLDAFGSDRVLILKFEDYVQDRVAGASQVFQFLGVSVDTSHIDASTVFNPSDRRPVAAGLWSHIQRSAVYRRAIRRLLPLHARDALRKAILPKAPPRPAPPRPETVDRILDELAPDLERLRALMGRSEPVWDVEQVRTAWREKHERWRREDESQRANSGAAA